jgi:hypothetical protein
MQTVAMGRDVGGLFSLAMVKERLPLSTLILLSREKQRRQMLIDGILILEHQATRTLKAFLF